MQDAQPPLPPIPPIPPLPGLLTPGDRPLSPRELEQVREVRGMLSDQLINVRERRGEVADLLRRAGNGAERTGLVQHLGVLDGRIATIEGDLERTRQMLTTGMMPEASTAVQPQLPPFDNFNNIDPGAMAGIAIVFTVVVLGPISIALARLLWRRATVTRASAPTWDSAQRMDRMEHAIDSIAVEVERISEGQRFVTRLLTESPNFGALNSGQRAGEPIAQREAVKVPRDER